MAILAIGVYVFHQLVLSVILLDYLTLTNSLKWFTPIGALQSDFEGTEQFFYFLEGVINLLLVGAMVFLIAKRGKDSGSTPNTSITSFGTSVPSPPQG